MNIEIRDITEQNWKEIINLEVKDNQSQFISKNVKSLAEMYVLKNAKALAFYSNNTAVGFATILIDDNSDYEIHRFMIDKKYQGKGNGYNSILKLIEYIRQLPNSSSRVKIMFIKENTIAEMLYEKVGFKDSGKVLVNEKEGYTEKIYYLDLSNRN